MSERGFFLVFVSGMGWDGRHRFGVGDEKTLVLDEPR